MAGLEWVLSRPGWKRYWETWRSQYPTDFAAFADDVVRKSEAALVREPLHMNWDAIGAIGELLGAAGVIVTLVPPGRRAVAPSGRSCQNGT